MLDQWEWRKLLTLLVDIQCCLISVTPWLQTLLTVDLSFWDSALMSEIFLNILEYFRIISWTYSLTLRSLNIFLSDLRPLLSFLAWNIEDIAGIFVHFLFICDMKIFATETNWPYLWETCCSCWCSWSPCWWRRPRPCWSGPRWAAPGRRCWSPFGKCTGTW